MSEEGYKTFNEDTAVYELSRLLYNPELWFPAYLSRIYVLEKQTKKKLYDHVLFINVFFRYDSKVNRYITMVDNVPIVVAGLVVPNDPTVPNNPNYKNNYYWIPGYCFNENGTGEKNLLGKNISEIRVITPKTQGEYNNSRFIKTFAYPLEEIKGIEDLKTKIIEKLLEIAESK